MRKVLTKVNDARLGRAIAGMVTRVLVVSSGKRGVKEYGMCIKGRYVSCRVHRERGFHCNHIAAVALHELGAAYQARSERKNMVGLLLQL